MNEKKMDEMEAEIVYMEDVKAKECFLTRVGKKIDERKLVRAEKRAEMTPEDKRKKRIKLGVIGGAVAAGAAIAIGMITNHGEAEELPMLENDMDTDEAPFELTDSVGEAAME